MTLKIPTLKMITVNLTSEGNQDFVHLEQARQEVEGLLRSQQSSGGASYKCGSCLKEGRSFKRSLGGVKVAKEEYKATKVGEGAI